MKLAEILTRYPDDYLKDLLKCQDADAATDLKHEDLVRRLCERLLAPGHIRNILETATSDERSLLYAIIFCGSIPCLLSEQQLHLQHIGITWKDTAIRALQQEGILHRFVSRERPFSNMYVLPQEILKDLAAFLIGNILKVCAAPLPESQIHVPMGCDFLAADILTMLYFASPDGIPKTVEGYPHRRFTRRWTDLMSPIDLAEDVLMSSDQVEGQPHVHRVGFTLEAATCYGYLLFEDERWAVSSESFNRLGGPIHSRFPEWMNIQMTWGNPRILMRQFLADLVRCLPEGMGLDPKRLMDWADPCPGNTPFSFSDEFKEELGCYLWRMVYIGLLHVIRDEKDRPLLVRTVLGNSVLNGKEIAPSQNDRMLVVQPNLEIMGDVINLANVGKDVAPFVEVVSAERTLLLRLSRDQVEKAIHAGYSVQNCVAALKQAATQPIAQNVFDTLEEWKRGYRRVYIRPAMLMQLDDEEQADVIRNGPLKKYIREEISPTVFRVLRNDLPDIRRILRRMKIHPVEKLRKKKGYSSAFRKKEYALKECMTPEYSSLGTFEPAEETLSKELSRYKISVYGAGMQHVNRKPRLTLTLGKMRSIVSEALHTRTPILIRLQKSDSGGTQEHVVLPIYWADQGRLLMISEEEDGKEFKLYLKDILEIQILSPEDGTGSRLF